MKKHLFKKIYGNLLRKAECMAFDQRPLPLFLLPAQ